MGLPKAAHLIPTSPPSPKPHPANPKAVTFTRATRSTPPREKSSSDPLRHPPAQLTMKGGSALVVVVTCISGNRSTSASGRWAEPETRAPRLKNGRRGPGELDGRSFLEYRRIFFLVFLSARRDRAPDGQDAGCLSPANAASGTWNAARAVRMLPFVRAERGSWRLNSGLRKYGSVLFDGWPLSTPRLMAEMKEEYTLGSMVEAVYYLSN